MKTSELNNQNTALADLWTGYGSRDVWQGCQIVFRQAVFGGSYRKPKFIGHRFHRALVERESYGADRGQHTFSLRILQSEGVQALKAGETLRIKGRNLYAGEPIIEVEGPLSARDDKHARGDAVRAEKAARREEMWA